MKVLVCICLSLLLVSCGSTLKRDPVIPAIVAGYPTLEFEACKKTWHGLGVCSLNSTQDYNDVGFRVQGYYKGTGRVVSQNCGIDRTFSYVENQKIGINIPGSANRNCLISVTLSPEYPDEEDGDIVIYSLRGHLALKIKDGESWQGSTRKVTGNWKNRLKVKVGGKGRVRVVTRGCGIRYDREHDIKSGSIYLELSEAVKKAHIGICVLEGVVIDPQFEDFLFTAVITQYATQLPTDPKWKDARFLPLATPAVEFESSNKVKITAPSVVSVLSLDKSFKIDNESTFSFDKKKYHIFRAVTVKGRSVLGFWYPSAKRFIWKQ